jgi:putative phosphoribosyl transferase
MSRIFEDRRDAGRALVPALQRCALTNPLILGLPRGGVPVAYEVALAMNAPLDTITVRKLGAPMQPELAIGAIASGGVRVLNDELISRLPGLDESTIDEIAEREMRELTRREQLYRGDWSYPEFRDLDVVLVDDGMATGATMRAAAEAVLSREPSKVVVAVPTASKEAVRLVAEKVDRVVCLETPSPFVAVGYFYRNFGQTDDDEVRELLAASRNRRPTARLPNAGEAGATPVNGAE